MSSQALAVRRALISVSDKTGLVDFARELHQAGVEILSTGGTARTLREAGIEVIDVSAHTGFPEIMGGRVKTLHPRIHGGILARRGIDDAVAEEHDIPPIDMVVVNLYPFEQTVAGGCELDDAIENIDIGGPAMVRAAAKNHASVAIVVDPSDYPTLIESLTDGIDRESRRRLAAKAYAHTAAYDGAITRYLSETFELGDAGSFNLSLRKRNELRYGENPHQKAAFYVEVGATQGSLAAAEQCQGKALSYNNIADADAALSCVKDFSEPACVIVKHANPCGVAEAGDIQHAYDLAFETDPTSAFGGIIAFNRGLDAATAKSIVDRQFVEVIIAPEIDQAAHEVLSAKPNLRVLQTGSWPEQRPASQTFKPVSGGLLVQDADIHQIAASDLKVVSKRQPSSAELADMLFAWRVVKHVKSNAIVYAGGGRTIGIGAGQMSRVISARIAGIKAEDAGLTVTGCAMASDAFFPFRDGIDAAAKAGVAAVIQPGGSKRDDEVIAAADEHGMAMVLTGIRHFNH